MRIERLTLQNFQSYRGEHTIDFGPLSLAVLSGANGAGKTTLIDALRWCLWGTSRTDAAGVITEGEERCRVELTFGLGSDSYLVSRQRSRRGSPVLTFQRSDGTLLDGKSIADTQARIVSVLGMDDALFAATACSAQGESDRFSRAKPAERKGVLVSILQLEAWERRAEIARGITRDLTVQVGGMITRIESLTAQASEADALLADMAETKATADGLDMQINALVQRLATLAEEREELVRAEAADTASRRELKAISAQLAELQPALQEAEERLESLRTTLAHQGEVEKGLAAATEAGTRADDMERVRQERERLTAELATLKAQYDGAVAEHQARVSQLSARIAEQQAAERERVGTVEREIAGLKAEQVQAERQHAAALELARLEVKNARALHEAKLSTKRAVILELQKRVAVLDTVPCQANETGYPFQTDCPLLAEALEAEKRLPALQEELAALEGTDPVAEQNRALSALLNLTPGAEIGERIAAIVPALLTPDPTPWEREHSQLVQLKHQRPGEDLEAQGHALRAQRDALEYDAEAHAKAKDTASSLVTWQRKQAEIEAAQAQLPSAEAALAARRAERDRLMERGEAVSQELGPARDFPAELAANADRQKAAAAEHQQAQTDIETLHRRHGELVARYDAATKAAQEATDLEAERAGLARRIAVLNLLGNPRDGAYSKGGIPALLIEQAIPQLEAAANDVLQSLADGRMSLELRTQREGGSGWSETLEIVVSDQQGPRLYETFSGGERMRVDLALRIGLSEMLAARAGARCELLVCDETAAPLDVRGREAFIEALGKVTDRFSCILCVSHCTDILDAFPSHIAVTKTAEGSRVEVMSR